MPIFVVDDPQNVGLSTVDLKMTEMIAIIYFILVLNVDET